MSELRRYVLDGAHMSTREEAHGELASVLSLPGYYGANLDALWDVASTMSADVVLRNTTDMLNALGVYGAKLLQTLYEAARENPAFAFRTE